MKNQNKVNDETLEKVTGGVEPVVEPINEPGIIPCSKPTIDLPQTDGTSTEALPNTSVTVKR